MVDYRVGSNNQVFNFLVRASSKQWNLRCGQSERSFLGTDSAMVDARTLPHS
jgi:hypothetical protein